MSYLKNRENEIVTDWTIFQAQRREVKVYCKLHISRKWWRRLMWPLRVSD